MHLKSDFDNKDISLQANDVLKKIDDIINEKNFQKFFSELSYQNSIPKEEIIF